MAAAVPVDVFVPAGAIADAPIYVDENDEIISRLPWLPWGPPGLIAGMQRRSLTHSEAMAAFAIKCKLDRSPASIVAAQGINPITIKLTTMAWSRILTQVRDNGLRATTIHLKEELHEYIRAKVPIVIIGAVPANDWDANPALTIPGAAGAARTAALRIRYLGLANVDALEIKEGALANVAPWTALCQLIGAIGNVGTPASRTQETAKVQTVSETIRTNSTDGNTDAVLAANLRSTIMRASLPKVFRAQSVTADELSSELTDAFRYKKSTSGRQAVEEARINLVGPPW